MTALYRTVFHIPLLLDATDPLDAQAKAEAATKHLANMAQRHGDLDGEAHHDTPARAQHEHTCAHCGHAARNPILISQPGQTPAYACLPVCPTREENAA